MNKFEFQSFDNIEDAEGWLREQIAQAEHNLS